MKVFIINIFLLLLFSDCNPSQGENGLNYDFENPTEDIKLEKKLNEISGLTFVNTNSLACINDEKGKIYQIDLYSFEQSKIIDFKDKGDFEGIIHASGKYYVLESNGDLYQVKHNGESKRFDLFKKGYEFEGLTITPDQKKLLLACKKHKSKEKDKTIWIYSFDIESKELDEKPFLKLRKDEIKENFRPSGLAFHPNGNLFIISGVSNIIVELNSELKPINQAQLPEFKYPQVEGICFDKNGGMYISSEKDYLERGKLYFLKQNEKK